MTKLGEAFLFAGFSRMMRVGKVDQLNDKLELFSWKNIINLEFQKYSKAYKYQ